MFQNRNLYIAFLFFLYLAVILIFAYVYFAIYTASPKSFSFNAETSKAQQEARFQSGVDEVNREREALAAMQTVLVELGNGAKPEFYAHDFVQVKFEIEDLIVTIYGEESNTILTIHDSRIGKKPKNYEGAFPFIAICQKAFDCPDTIKQYIAMLEIRIVRLEKDLEDTGDTWTFWDFFYFSTMTQTTVGYGDMLPNTTTVRMVVSLQLILSNILLIWALNVVFTKKRKPRNKKKILEIQTSETQTPET